MKKDKFDFNDLFIFEMANNHQGSVEHGKKIIDEMGKITREYGLKAAIKFQFRHHKTFVHPDSIDDKKNKLVKRFLSTELSEKQFETLIKHARKAGLIIMASTWDEKSVDMASRLNIDIIKIASCSAKDWPLLLKVSTIRKPVIISTSGLNISDIDNLASFGNHKYMDFAFMHCFAHSSAENLASLSNMNLNQLVVLKNRYPTQVIGLSTHESPDNYEAIQVAYALGARMFEKHVGVETDKIKLNTYSANPEQVRKWIESYKRVVAMCGLYERIVSAEEEEDLNLIRRGTFAKINIKKGQRIKEDDVFHAFPLREGQITSGEFNPEMIADRNYKKNEPLSRTLFDNLSRPLRVLWEAIHKVRGMLNESKIHVGIDNDVVVSHHYGLDRFFEIGSVMIECINREYCKMILVMLPKQSYPRHYHKKKEEALQVLSGRLDLEVEGRHKILLPGDVMVIRRGVRHSFSTDTGVIFEEISTTYFNGDSVYEDPDINAKDNSQRKTKLINWGFHQFD